MNENYYFNWISYFAPSRGSKGGPHGPGADARARGGERRPVASARPVSGVRQARLEIRSTRNNEHCRIQTCECIVTRKRT